MMIAGGPDRGEPDFTGGSHRNQPYRSGSDDMAKRRMAGEALELQRSGGNLQG